MGTNVALHNEASEFIARRLGALLRRRPRGCFWAEIQDTKRNWNSLPPLTPPRDTQVSHQGDDDGQRRR